MKLSFILSGILAIGIYSMFIERRLLRKKKLNLKNKNSENKKNIKIIHFTDVHFGKFFNKKLFDKLINKINLENPDIVILTGDLVDKMRFYNDDGYLDKRLKDIKSKYGKFAVYGNHDSYPGNRHTYAKILKNSNFTLLKNENIKLNIDNRLLNIIGLDDYFQGEPDYNKVINLIDTENFNLLLLHEPDLTRKFLDTNIDLALAGHSHGGQIYIPLYGTIANTGLAKSFDRGLYKFKNKKLKLYVNSGIGSTGLPIRFCCIPNISIIEITI